MYGIAIIIKPAAPADLRRARLVSFSRAMRFPVIMILRSNHDGR
jgi:hypothetical protein